MSTLDEVTWNEWMAFLDALGEAGLTGVFLSQREVTAMVAAFRQPPAVAEDPPHFMPYGPAHPGLRYEKLWEAQAFKEELESAGFTVDEMRRASNLEAARIMLRALAQERYHEMMTPPTTWNEGDYVALGPDRKLLAAERTATRAKEMAVIRGCPTPLILPATRLKRPQP